MRHSASPQPRAELRLLQLLNTARLEAGTTPLRSSLPLGRICEAHAKDFTQHRYFALEAPDGLGVEGRLESMPYRFERGAVIILRSANPTPEFAAARLLNRYPEDALEPRYHSLGLARARGRSKMHWVLYLMG